MTLALYDGSYTFVVWGSQEAKSSLCKLIWYLNMGWHRDRLRNEVCFGAYFHSDWRILKMWQLSVICNAGDYNNSSEGCLRLKLGEADA